MKPRYFWLLSDGKTVREISWQQFKDLTAKDQRDQSKTYALCIVSNDEISFRQGRRYFWVRRNLLDQVLEACKQ